MATDGGVYHSTDGGRTWSLTSGLATLQPPNLAGVALPGKSPALYFGVADNDNFFSLNGGITWNNPITGCGDCGPWFSDPAQPDRFFEFNGPGRGDIAVYVGKSAEEYPDGRNADKVPFPSGFRHAYSSADTVAKLGYKPIILTPVDEEPLPDGDYILIRKKTDGNLVLLRTTKITTIQDAGDWDTAASEDGPTTKVFQQGPPLPNVISDFAVVQAAGGHEKPVFYVGDPQ